MWGALWGGQASRTDLGFEVGSVRRGGGSLMDRPSTP
jgi:hypothetical protein